jgi:hypothetical protein
MCDRNNARNQSGRKVLSHKYKSSPPFVKETGTFFRFFFCSVLPLSGYPTDYACSLNLLENNLLELPLNLLALVVRCRLAVEGHEGAEVELGRLQQLDLADVYLEISS